MSLSDLTRHLVTSSKAKRERGNEEKGEEREKTIHRRGKTAVTFVQVIIAFNDFLTTVFGSRQKKKKKKSIPRAYISASQLPRFIPRAHRRLTRLCNSMHTLARVRGNEDTEKGRPVGRREKGKTARETRSVYPPRIILLGK